MPSRGGVGELNAVRINFLFNCFYCLLMAVYTVMPGFSQEIKFGVIADIHHGYLTDVNKRLQVFIDVSKIENVDFIIQLGDFNLSMTEDKSGDFLDIWNSFEGPGFHVLGNHDMDNHTKQEVREYWGMEGNYYTFDMKGFHFVVMDENFIKQGDGTFIDYENSNYYSMDRDWHGDEQVNWFEEDLTNTSLPTLKFSHSHRSAKDRVALENIISQANAGSDYKKFLLSLNGHGHADLEEVIDNVPYVEIPTASHAWEGQAEPYSTVRFAIVTINAQNGTLDIDGYSEDVEYQQGLPTHEGTITDRSYTYNPIEYGCKDSLHAAYNPDADVHDSTACSNVRIRQNGSLYK